MWWCPRNQNRPAIAAQIQRLRPKGTRPRTPNDCPSCRQQAAAALATASPPFTATCKKIEPFECRPQRALPIDVRSIFLLFAIMLVTTALRSASCADIWPVRLAATILTDIGNRFRLAECSVTVLTCVALHSAPAAGMGFNSNNTCCRVALSAAIA